MRSIIIVRRLRWRRWRSCHASLRGGSRNFDEEGGGGEVGEFGFVAGRDGCVRE